MPDEYLSFDDALRDLQMQEAELRSLVAQGKLRAFRDENTLKFRRSDVESLRKQREAEPTLRMRQEPKREEPAPLAEEPIDLLADQSLDYDDTAETIIGGDLGAVATGDTDLALGEPAPPPPDRKGTKVPTIELTPAEAAAEHTEDTTIPAAGGGVGTDTEVPTMVLGLDEYDDTQVATEDVATEEVFIQEGDLAAPAAGEGEEPTAAPGEEGEAERAVGSITGSSSFGTGEPLAIREQPSPLFTAMCGLAAFILLVPAGVFVWCLLSKTVPKWGILDSIMRFWLNQLHPQ